jgi:hypothetical protein
VADSLIFDGVNDRLEYALAAPESPSAYTIACIRKRTISTATWTQTMYIAQDTVGGVYGMGIDGSIAGRLICDLASGPVLWNGGSDPSLAANNNWVLCVIDNPGGGASAVASIYDYTAGTWLYTTISAGENPPEDPLFTNDVLSYGAWLDSSLVPADYWAGNILIAGWWLGGTLTGTDRDALRFSLQSWIDLDPSIAHRFDSASAPMSIGSSTPPVLALNTGAVLDVGDVPAGWDDTLGPVQPAGPWVPNQSRRRYPKPLLRSAA